MHIWMAVKLSRHLNILSGRLEERIGWNCCTYFKKFLTFFFYMRSFFFSSLVVSSKNTKTKLVALVYLLSGENKTVLAIPPFFSGLNEFIKDMQIQVEHRHDGINIRGSFYLKKKIPFSKFNEGIGSLPC